MDVKYSVIFRIKKKTFHLNVGTPDIHPYCTESLLIFLKLSLDTFYGRMAYTFETARLRHLHHWYVFFGFWDHLED